MLISVLRFLKGYVCFRAEGVFAERFLTLLIKNGFAVWDIRKEDYVLRGCVFAAKYKLLRRFARKTNVRLRIDTKCGAPFFVRENKRRGGVLLGAVIFIAFLSTMNSFVWRIDVVGNETVSNELILQTAYKYGLRTGAPAASLDALDIERRMFIELKDISWIAINIEESTATINVKESVPAPRMLRDNDAPCNVVASRDGVIRRIIASAGQEMLTEGNVVMKGDVIVSGIIGYSDGRREWKHARARVYAETEHFITVEIPLEQTEEHRTGTHAYRGTLELFGFEFPLREKAYEHEAYIFRNTEPVRFLWFELPVKRVKYDYMFYDKVAVTLTENQAKARALEALELRRAAELGDAEILRSNITGIVRDGCFVLKADYLCIMDIAEEQSFEPALVTD